MAYTMRDGDGTLFKNNFRKEGDKRPDMKGDFLLNGEIHEIAAWEKTNKDGGKFFSLKIQRKSARPAQNQEPEKEIPTDLKDDVPF